MTGPFTFPSTLFRRAPLGRALLLVALALPFAASAQEEQQDPKQISERVSDGLTKIKPLTDDKKWDEALGVIDGLLAVAKPGSSYERAVLNDIKGKIFLQKSDYVNSIAPMELALQISDEHPYFEPRYLNEMAKFLAQLYYQEAVAPGRTRPMQLANFKKASGYIKRVIDAAHGRPSPDDVVLSASIIYNLATTLNPEKVDLALIREAQTAVEGALLLSVKPRPQIYEFLVATLSQQSDYRRGAEILELLLKINPNGTNYWTQLAAMYLALATEEKDKEKLLRYNVRAILTIERAQALGQMTTPKDNYNLVSIYLLIGQFDRACEMLEAGLKNGTIEQDEKNWLQLSYYYQQVNKEAKALEILRVASRHFPREGMLNFQAAQIYYSLGDLNGAYRESRSAAAKGAAVKTGQVWQFIAYCAYELHKLPEALDAVNRASAATSAQKDARVVQLKKVIEEAIKERDQQTEALKAKQKL